MTLKCWLCNSIFSGVLCAPPPPRFFVGVCVCVCVCVWGGGGSQEICFKVYLKGRGGFVYRSQYKTHSCDSQHDDGFCEKTVWWFETRKLLAKPGMIQQSRSWYSKSIAVEQRAAIVRDSLHHLKSVTPLVFRKLFCRPRNCIIDDRKQMISSCRRWKECACWLANRVLSIIIW